ncbi:hypothetical protein RRG08_000336 [Elysia crispata]|uniref:Chitin-binding type-2 domain-containing protein n=1 Tax=Elysia crispata TaxID=231223 RepID=A0AAE0Z9M3_9GAST|nr:hypothetical protein RRG08_000336 [Elysia crispata]
MSRDFLLCTSPKIQNVLLETLNLSKERCVYTSEESLEECQQFDHLSDMAMGDKPGSPTGQLGDRPDKQDGEKRMQAKKDGDSKPADKSMKKDGTEKDNMGDTGRDGARNRDRPGGAREVTGMKSAQISSTETSSRPSSSESVKMALTFLAVGLASPESSGARTNRGWWPTRTCVTTTSIVLLRMMINPYHMSCTTVRCVMHHSNMCRVPRQDVSCTTVRRVMYHELVERMCRWTGNNYDLPHYDECHKYYDCTNSSAKVGENEADYVRTCKYPQLFSVRTGKCEDYGEVECGTRKEPLTPCEYMKCEDPDLASCVGFPDGDNVCRTKEGSPHYVTCRDQRTVEKHMCPLDSRGLFMQFAPGVRQCLPVDASA